VAEELGLLYREVRRGQIASADGSRMASILAVLRQCLEASTVETRLAELEALLAEEPATNVVPFKRGVA
jgi:hypothetical protein